MVLGSAPGLIQARSGFGLKEEMIFWHQAFGFSGPPACPSPAWSGSAGGSLPAGRSYGPEARVLPYNHLYV